MGREEEGRRIQSRLCTDNPMQASNSELYRKREACETLLFHMRNLGRIVGLLPWLQSMFSLKPVFIHFCALEDSLVKTFEDTRVSRRGDDPAEAEAQGTALPEPSTRALGVGECPCARNWGPEGPAPLARHLKPRFLTTTFSKAMLKVGASSSACHLVSAPRRACLAWSGPWRLRGNSAPAFLSNDTRPGQVLQLTAAPPPPRL